MLFFSRSDPMIGRPTPAPARLVPGPG